MNVTRTRAANSGNKEIAGSENSLVRRKGVRPKNKNVLWSSRRKTETKTYRKLETRRKLIAAARMLFAERGYQLTSPDDISNLAGLSHGAFYIHFKDKFDCYVSLLEETFYELSVLTDWHCPEKQNPEETIRFGLHVAFDYSLAHPGILQVMLCDTTLLNVNMKRRKLSQYADIWLRRIEDWQADGVIAGDFDCKLFVQMMTGAVKEGDLLIARNPRSMNRIIDGLVSLLMRAIHE